AAPEFTAYCKRVVENAKALGEALLAKGFSLVTGGTDNHLLLIDLSEKGVPGKVAAKALEGAGIVVNANTVPFDRRKPFDPSGIRLGTPAITSRGLPAGEMPTIAGFIAEVVAAPDDAALSARVAREVGELLSAYSAPGLSPYLVS